MFVTSDGAPAGIAKWGKYSDPAGTAKDTAVPEFVDRFASPLPKCKASNLCGQCNKAIT